MVIHAITVDDVSVGRSAPVIQQGALNGRIIRKINSYWKAKINAHTFIFTGAVMIAASIMMPWVLRENEKIEFLGGWALRLFGVFFLMDGIYKNSVLGPQPSIREDQ